MTTRSADPRCRELGDFLRSRRERLQPDALKPGERRRRTPGLRREEVAERAGIGVDWYVRLEQGRNVSASPATIDALARALHLQRAEHDHLRALASNAAPRVGAYESVPAGLHRLVQSLDQPAYVTNRRWDILSANPPALDLFGFDAIETRPLNTLVYMFMDPAARRLFGKAWDSEAQRMLAQFRATYDLYADDRSFAELLMRLQSQSAQFLAWWNAHDIRTGGSGRKLLDHPRHGLLRYEYSTFQSNENPALKLAIYKLDSD